MMPRTISIIALMGALSLAALTPGPGQEGHEFMPKGGKTLLIELLGTPLDAARLREITQGQHSEEEWSDALAGQMSAMSEQQRHTISAYLAVNMPLPEGALETAESQGDAIAALPPDGRELAWNECQFCHSLFSSHLTQDRDGQAWLNMFESPFHREIKMSAQQREIFARYSAINMPMRVEDVPAELRF